MTGMAHPGIFETAFSWLASYGVHSTILLAGAWLGGRLLGERRLELQEVLWRVALIGGLVTATLQLATGLRPIAGEFRLLGLSHPVEVSAARPTASSEPQPDTAVRAIEGGRVGGIETGRAARRSGTGNLAPSSATSKWSVLLLLGWASGAAIAMIGLFRSRLRLKRLLRTGRSMPPGRSIQSLAKTMGVFRPVDVRLSPAFKMPFATGVWNPRICVPNSTLRELSPRELDNLLAHEMAHLARRDPAWIVLCRLLTGVLFFQPLNRAARRRLETLAECLCDDRAIAFTGRPLDLARCLLQVAEQTTNERPMLAAAAVASRSRLAHRVERLLRPPVKKTPCARWVGVAWTLCLLGATAVLPAISASAVDPSSPRAGGAGGFGGIMIPADTVEPPEARETPDPVEAATPVEVSDVMTPPDVPEASAEPEEVCEPEAVNTDETASAAAAEAATRAIEEHIAALEAETESLEQAQTAIRFEMQRLQRQLREMNRERGVSREEIERMRAEARRLGKEKRRDPERLEAMRTELRDQRRQFEEQMREERLRARELNFQEVESKRRAEFEEQRRAAEERMRAEQLACERAEIELQERQRDEQLARERAEFEEQERQREEQRAREYEEQEKQKNEGDEQRDTD